MTKNYLEQQTSKYYIKAIQQKGCYFLCLLWGACAFVDKALKPSQVMKLYEDAIEKKIMTKTCYVNNPAKIITLALNMLEENKYRARYVGSERDGQLGIYNESLSDNINYTVDNIQIMWEDKNKELHYGSHFVTKEYNPDERLIKTGKEFGKRYFFIGDK